MVPTSYIRASPGSLPLQQSPWILLSPQLPPTPFLSRQRFPMRNVSVTLNSLSSSTCLRDVRWLFKVHLGGQARHSPLLCTCLHIETKAVWVDFFGLVLDSRTGRGIACWPWQCGHHLNYSDVSLTKLFGMLPSRSFRLSTHHVPNSPGPFSDSSRLKSSLQNRPPSYFLKITVLVLQNRATLGICSLASPFWSLNLTPSTVVPTLLLAHS